MRDIQRLHKTELMRFSRSGDNRHRRLVELSVIEQCLAIFKNPSVQVRRMQLPRLLLLLLLLVLLLVVVVVVVVVVGGWVGGVGCVCGGGAAVDC